MESIEDFIKQSFNVFKLLILAVTMNIFFFNLTLLFSIIIFTKKNNLTFWDFILNLSNRKRVSLVILSLFLPICFGLFYSYIISLEMFTWYFITCLMILTIGVYYILSNISNFIILNFFNKSLVTRQTKFDFSLKGVFLIEAIVFAFLAFLFKENEHVFWFLFYVIPVYRLAVILVQKTIRVLN